MDHEQILEEINHVLNETKPEGYDPEEGLSASGYFGSISVDFADRRLDRSGLKW